MKNLNLSDVISGYKTVFKNLPDDCTYEYSAINADYDYSDTLDLAFQGMHDVLSALLQTQEFAFVDLPNAEIVKIFNTDEERDAFVNDRTFAEVNKATVTPISYDEFLSFAQGNEFVLPYYSSNPVDNCVDFSLMGFYSEEDVEE